MSGEQITNNAVETQTSEGELHSLKDSPKKKKSRYKRSFEQC